MSGFLQIRLHMYYVATYVKNFIDENYCFCLLVMGNYHIPMIISHCCANDNLELNVCMYIHILFTIIDTGKESSVLKYQLRSSVYVKFHLIFKSKPS